MLLVGPLGFFSLNFLWAAQDLGNLGKVYPILEQDALERIQEKMNTFVKSGQYQKEAKKYGERFKSYLKRPRGLSLPQTNQERLFTYDPTFVLSREITDASGRILYRKGTRVNPLKVIRLNKKLCFINADDPEQVEWIQKDCSDNLLNKFILTQGDYLELSQKLKRRLYFDQRGFLTQKFGIKAVPAMVYQQEGKIYVKEIFLN